MSGDNVVYSNHVMTITGRIKPTLAPPTSGYSGGVTAYTKSVGVQCHPSDWLCSSDVQVRWL